MLAFDVSKKPKVILTYGTFDLFHYGHLRILERARALGDHLITGVSTDTFNQIKGKACHYPFKERLKIVESIRFVDQVIPEDSWDQKTSDIQTYGVDTLVMGDDWIGQFDHLLPYCNVVYLPRTSGISTTGIKEELSKMGLK